MMTLYGKNSAVNKASSTIANPFTNKMLCATLEKSVTSESGSSVKNAVIFLKRKDQNNVSIAIERNSIENSLLFGGPPSGYKMRKQFAFRRRGSFCDAISCSKNLVQKSIQSTNIFVDLKDITVKGAGIGQKSNPNAVNQKVRRVNKRLLQRKKPFCHTSIGFYKPNPTPDLLIQQHSIKPKKPCFSAMVTIKALPNKIESRPRTQLSSPLQKNVSKLMRVSGNTITPFISPYESIFPPEPPRKTFFNHYRVLVNGVCQTCTPETGKRVSSSFITEAPEMPNKNRLYQSLVLKTRLQHKNHRKVFTSKPEENVKDISSAKIHIQRKFMNAKRVRKGRVFSDAQFYFSP